MVTNKTDQSDPMDVVEISVGRTPESWDVAQMHPPGAQQPAMDPFADQVEKADPEDLDAGAKWPRQPGGPRDEENVGPLSVQMGTQGPQEADAEDEPKVVTAEEGDSAHEGEAAPAQKPPTFGRGRK